MVLFLYIIIINHYYLHHQQGSINPNHWRILCPTQKGMATWQLAMGCLRRRLAYFPSSPRPQDSRIRQGTKAACYIQSVGSACYSLFNHQEALKAKPDVEPRAVCARVFFLLCYFLLPKHSHCYRHSSRYMIPQKWDLGVKWVSGRTES